MLCVRYINLEYSVGVGRRERCSVRGVLLVLVCACVYVCVCVGERGRQTEKGRGGVEREVAKGILCQIGGFEKKPVSLQ